MSSDFEGPLRPHMNRAEWTIYEALPGLVSIAILGSTCVDFTFFGNVSARFLATDHSLAGISPYLAEASRGGDQEREVRDAIQWLVEGGSSLIQLRHMDGINGSPRRYADTGLPAGPDALRVRTALLDALQLVRDDPDDAVALVDAELHFRMASRHDITWTCDEHLPSSFVTHLSAHGDEVLCDAQYAASFSKTRAGHERFLAYRFGNAVVQCAMAISPVDSTVAVEAFEACVCRDESLARLMAEFWVRDAADRVTNEAARIAREMVKNRKVVKAVA